MAFHQSQQKCLYYQYKLIIRYQLFTYILAHSNDTETMNLTKTYFTIYTLKCAKTSQIAICEIYLEWTNLEVRETRHVLDFKLVQAVIQKRTFYFCFSSL